MWEGNKCNRVASVSVVRERLVGIIWKFKEIERFENTCKCVCVCVVVVIMVVALGRARPMRVLGT